MSEAEKDAMEVAEEISKALAELGPLLRRAPHSRSVAVRGFLEEQGRAIPSCPWCAVQTLWGVALGMFSPSRLIAPENGFKTRPRAFCC